MRNTCWLQSEMPGEEQQQQQEKKEKQRGSKSMPLGCPKSIEALKYGFAPARRVLCKRRPTIWLTRRINDKCNHCGRQLQERTQQKGREKGGETSQKVGEHERMIKTLRGTLRGLDPIEDRELPASVSRRSMRVPCHAPFQPVRTEPHSLQLNVLWLAEHNLLACCDSACWSGSTSCCVSVGCASLSTSSPRVIPCCSFTTTPSSSSSAAQKLFAGFDCV